MKTWVKVLISAAITLVYSLAAYYFQLPIINLHAPGFYFFIIGKLLVFWLVFAFINRRQARQRMSAKNLQQATFTQLLRSSTLFTRILFITASVLMAVLIIGSISSMRIFNATRYQQMLQVEEGDFAKDIPAISFEQIPSLDRDSAALLANRKLGELSDMVSQFEVSEAELTQVNFQGRPVRVTPLYYADLFKWLNNYEKGLPGYMRIDMVTQEVSLVRLEKGMHYTPYDHFGRNLNRHLRFQYPTWIFADINFDIDDNGTPYWICPRVTYTIGLFGGRDIDGAVLVNAVTGESEFFPLADIPTWVDRAFNADLLIEQYNNYGTLRHGWLNSIFGQKDTLKTTEGYNYIAKEDDVFLYTGVTSVGKDESNVGFVLINQRTKETKYYAIPGAEEYSAMSSAEGMVQHLGYTSTFPLLLNVADQPTYFVALKDASGLVKMYAMVNVKQYQLVATGQTIADCQQAYQRLIDGSAISNEEEKEVSGTLAEIRTAVTEGNTVYYLRLENAAEYYAISVARQADIPLLNTGDKVTIRYEEKEGALKQATRVTRE